MIKMSIWTSITSPAYVYITKEYESGLVSHYSEGGYHVFTFYNPEDESAFILTYGTDFKNNDNIAYYCPYIPLNFTITAEL